MQKTKMQYCIVEQESKEHHAGAKARNDVYRILKNNKWECIAVSSMPVRYNAGLKDKVRAAIRLEKEWSAVVKKIPESATLLIQYPLDMYPKVSILARRFLVKLRKHNVKIVFLIHDLDSLRTEDKKRREIYRRNEMKFLGTGDILIAHNDIMIDYLNMCGFKQKKLSLELFDYLMPEKLSMDNMKREKNQIVIAGNLSESKAGYIYKLDKIGKDVEFLLYGPGYEKRKECANARYIGSYSPEELVIHLQGGFGLVWDGDSIEECKGVYGEYMKYNNPHKASLYLAAGFPVIVNNSSAIAKFVNKYNVGISVNSLLEISECLQNISNSQYEEMQNNVKELACKLRTGKMLETILQEIK